MERDIRPIRIALAGTVGAIGALLSFGPDQWVRPVSADTPTPISTPATPARTPTPTGTPTPDVLATQIVEAKAAATASTGQLKQEKELADLRATITATQSEINAARGTPTSTPTPDATARAIATRDAAAAQEVAGIQTTATAAAAERERRVPTTAPAPAVEQLDKKEEGGSPLGGVLLISILLTAGAGAAFWARQRIGSLIRRVRGEEDEEDEEEDRKERY